MLYLREIALIIFNRQWIMSLENLNAIKFHGNLNNLPRQRAEAYYGRNLAKVMEKNSQFSLLSPFILIIRMICFQKKIPSW